MFSRPKKYPTKDAEPKVPTYEQLQSEIVQLKSTIQSLVQRNTDLGRENNDYVKEVIMLKKGRELYMKELNKITTTELQNVSRLINSCNRIIQPFIREATNG